MLNQSQIQTITPKLMGTQVLAAAITMGGVMFSAVIASITKWDDLEGPVKLLSTIAAGTSIIVFGMAFVAPSIFPKTPTRLRPTDDSNREKGLFEIATLLFNQQLARYAMLEAGIFINAVALMLEPRWLNIVGIGFGLLLMLLAFPLKFRTLPTVESRYEEWAGDI